MNDRSISGAISLVLVMLVLSTCTSSGVEPSATAPSAIEQLPVRAGERTETSYSVPHVQVLVDPVDDVDEELRRRMFLLPDVERRESIASIRGAEGLWLSPAVPNLQASVREREFAHIHPDGSLHLVLPVDRALEAIETKWAEFHPWVGRDDFWDGMVMLYTPQSHEEAAVTLQLIVDSYNFVTGRSISVADID